MQQSQANQQLEQKVNSLRYRNTLKPESSTSSEQSGGQQLKTPEYLMQRLNDMKNKVQTLVGN